MVLTLLSLSIKVCSHYDEDEEDVDGDVVVCVASTRRYDFVCVASTSRYDVVVWPEHAVMTLSVWPVHAVMTLLSDQNTPL